MQMMTLHRLGPAGVLAVIAFMGSTAQESAAGEWGRPLGPAYGGPEVRMRAVAPAAPMEAEESHTIQVF